MPLWVVAPLAVAALSACAPAHAASGLPAGLWWFACLALLGLAAAAYALGRLSERRARAAELFEARSRHTALLGSLDCTVWHSDASHRLLPGADATASTWWAESGLQHALATQRPFSGLRLHAGWLLHGDRKSVV